MSITWKAPPNILDLVSNVRAKHHPSLEEADITAALADNKPYSGDRLNWGTVKRFSDFSKIWQVTTYDFCIVICSDVWHTILREEQREPLVDLHLSRIEPEYEPETIAENGRKRIVKDDNGKVKYTETVKLDDDGNPKWKLLPLDIMVFAKNIERYGLWVDEFADLEEAVTDAHIMADGRIRA